MNTEIGLPRQQVSTPAVVVDLDVMERNLMRMAARKAAARGKVC